MSHCYPQISAAEEIDNQVAYLDGLASRCCGMARPRLHRGELPSKTAAELDALLPSILDKAFKGEL